MTKTIKPRTIPIFVIVYGSASIPIIIIIFYIPDPKVIHRRQKTEPEIECSVI
jgi:hypothetical protein